MLRPELRAAVGRRLVLRGDEELGLADPTAEHARFDQRNDEPARSKLSASIVVSSWLDFGATVLERPWADPRETSIQVEGPAARTTQPSDLGGFDIDDPALAPPWIGASALLTPSIRSTMHMLDAWSAAVFVNLGRATDQ